MRTDWRPKDWNNPYKDYWGKIGITIKEDYETNQHFSYEAGADAMLEALGHFECVHVEKGAFVLGGAKTLFPQTIIFIPDKEG